MRCLNKEGNYPIWPSWATLCLNIHKVTLLYNIYKVGTSNVLPYPLSISLICWKISLCFFSIAKYFIVICTREKLGKYTSYISDQSLLNLRPQKYTFIASSSDHVWLFLWFILNTSFNWLKYKLLHYYIVLCGKLFCTSGHNIFLLLSIYFFTSDMRRSFSS